MYTERAITSTEEQLCWALPSQETLPEIEYMNKPNFN